jgi:hypothetical protein
MSDKVGHTIDQKPLLAQATVYSQEFEFSGGRAGTRTPDLLRVKQAL